MRGWARWLLLSSIAMFGAAAASFVAAFALGDPLPTYPDGFPSEAARAAADVADLLLAVAGYLALGALTALLLGLGLAIATRSR